MKKIQLALIGAGNRGQYSYAPYALGREYEVAFSAVAEPDAARRESFAKTYGVPADRCFESYEQLLAQPRLADAVMVCTQDRMHVAPAVMAMENGYDILLEKPIAPTPQECMQLLGVAQKTGRLAVVCHVLRYTPFFGLIKQILDEGAVGRIVSLCHNENVAFWHYAHSYVRGNWRSTKLSSPMILAKSCHDMDIMAWFVGAKCTAASSAGSLMHFKSENAPAGAPKRCLDGCPHSATCPYYAPKVYLADGYRWRTARETLGNGSDEDVLRQLREGPYGRCVYHCDNDVVDHQVATLEFENGVTAAFSMCAFTNKSDRTLKVMGTEGELRANMTLGEIETVDFATRTYKTYRLPEGDVMGHFGGDSGIMRDFLAVLRGEKPNTNAFEMSVHAHMMAFAAEASRLDGRRVAVQEMEG